MTTAEIIAQALSIVAMSIYFVSYLQKKQRAIIFFQFMATACFSISFFMLDATMGFLLNAVSAIRAILFVYKNKLKTDNICWLIGFLAVYALCYAMSFTVFEKELILKNILIELLPVVGMVATTFSFRAKSAKAVRIGGLINEPAWLIYNIISFSIGGILCNIFSLCAIIFAIMRLDKKRANTTAE